jgi:hypothetical protein
LRNPPLPPIPDGLTARSAALAEGRGAHDGRLERRLQAGLLVLPGLASMLSIAMLYGQWLRTLVTSAGGPAASALRILASWASAIVVCIVFSWLMERWLHWPDGLS